MKLQMHTTQINPGDRHAPPRRSSVPGIVVLCILLAVTAVGAGCTRSPKTPTSSTAEREAALRQIASDYARDGDLARAQSELDQVALANPVQMLVLLAEEGVSAGRAAAEIEPLARLANDLGSQSPKLLAYLAPTAAPTATPVPPTATPVPPTPTVPPTATATAEPPTLTPAPPTLSPTSTPPPQKPRVVADGAVNLRSGPGRAYPVVGRLAAGQEVEILARNANGDWWQLDTEGQAWVAGTVVSVLGPIDLVAVAENIPTPPPQPTAAPRPTAPPAAAPPQNPSEQYVVQSLRLRSVGESAQRCNAGDHNIFVLVVDAAGNPLDGVRVREVFTGQIHVTGAQGKGPGRVEYDIYRGGGGQVDIVNEANEPIGQTSRGMSADWPAFDLMRDAGYCGCKPHPDDASCEADLNSKSYLFAVGHYAYEVVYRRTY